MDIQKSRWYSEGKTNSHLGGHDLTGNEYSVRKKGNDGYLWSEAYMFNAVCYKDNYFSKRKFKLFNGLFHSVYLVFSTHLLSIANMFAMGYLWKTYVTKRCDK